MSQPAARRRRRVRQAKRWKKYAKKLYGLDESRYVYWGNTLMGYFFGKGHFVPNADFIP